MDLLDLIRQIILFLEMELVQLFIVLSSIEIGLLNDVAITTKDMGL